MKGRTNPVQRRALHMSAQTATLTWAVLAALTILTGALSRNAEAEFAIGALVALAAVKIYLILSVFMGVSRGPAGWHIGAIAWLAALMAVLAMLAYRSAA